MSESSESITAGAATGPAPSPRGQPNVVPSDNLHEETEQQPSRAVVPGFYPDILDPKIERYWNGIQWTPEIRPGEPSPRRNIIRGPARAKQALFIGVVVLIVLIGGAAVAFALLHDDGKSDSSTFAGYGQRPLDIAKKLKACKSVKAFSKSVARCVSYDGDFVAILTEDDADSQELGVALIKDDDSGNCVVVLKGVIISAENESVLTSVVGVPEEFASKNGGYTLCPVP